MIGFYTSCVQHVKWFLLRSFAFSLVPLNKIEVERVLVCSYLQAISYALCIAPWLCTDRTGSSPYLILGMAIHQLAVVADGHVAPIRD